MENVAKDTNYRLKPSLLNALIIFVAYVLILIGMETLSGVPYTEITKSSANMFYGILIPVLIGSIILTIVALWSGWWKDVWRDKYKIKNHSWMHIFLILAILAIIFNFLRGGIGSVDSTFIIVTFIATALVGYSEELLTRGLLIRGARGSELTEIKVFLIVMLVFGCMHSINIINGQALSATFQQIVFTGLAGGVYYVIFRKTGFLVVTMVLHTFYDFSTLTAGFAIPIMYFLALGLTLLSFILLIPAARNFNVKKTK